jgi:RNA-directed DNA polymerase
MVHRRSENRGVVRQRIANLYMNRFLKYWRITGKGKKFRAQVVNYADDFVILSRGHAVEALDWTRGVMGRIGLTLNEAKTHIRKANSERFDFLGYTFGPHRFRKDGYRFIGESPSKKSLARVRQKVGDLLVSESATPWPELRDRLNAMLRGWSNYFSLGDRYAAYRAVNNHVYQRVRVFLRRRHKVSSLGTASFPHQVVYGKLGVFFLPATVGFRPLMVKSVGKPDARNGHVRFDERGRETGGCQ